ncbi:AbiH family protein [Parabacteroides sp.]|uniref:AbiH family protein n=1 Tax=Parabacteroides sp. TaxID=1869337 RepID=UPI00259BAD2B|nr:AbiH family protein [uncultured Parabacteroides sp.]
MNIFFDDLYDVKHIYVMGHSLGNVDLPYFKKISSCNSTPKKINWHVSYYADSEREKLKKLMQDNIMDQGASLELFKMEEIQFTSR